jgi:hypothetical protein
MDQSNFIQLGILCVACLVAAAGWWQGRTQKAEEEGAKDTRLKAIELAVEDARTDIKAVGSKVTEEIGKVYQRIETCRLEDMGRHDRIEDRLNNHINGSLVTSERKGCAHE